MARDTASKNRFKEITSLAEDSVSVDASSSRSPGAIVSSNAVEGVTTTGALVGVIVGEAVGAFVDSEQNMFVSETLALF